MVFSHLESFYRKRKRAGGCCNFAGFNSSYARFIQNTPFMECFFKESFQIAHVLENFVLTFKYATSQTIDYGKESRGPKEE